MKNDGDIWCWNCCSVHDIKQFQHQIMSIQHGVVLTLSPPLGITLLPLDDGLADRFTLPSLHSCVTLNYYFFHRGDPSLAYQQDVPWIDVEYAGRSMNMNSELGRAMERHADYSRFLTEAALTLDKRQPKVMNYILLYLTDRVIRRCGNTTTKMIEVVASILGRQFHTLFVLKLPILPILFAQEEHEDLLGHVNVNDHDGCYSSLAECISSYTNKPGLPLVTVIRREEGSGRHLINERGVVIQAKQLCGDDDLYPPKATTDGGWGDSKGEQSARRCRY